MSQTVESTQDELDRRHRQAVRVISWMSVITLSLIVLALAIAPRLSLDSGPIASNSLLFIILFLGLGSLIFRRTKFATMRLRDIAALRGASGLLETLQRTTVSVALIGGLISVLGFIFALMTGVGKNVFYPSVIAAAVLLYDYPRRAAWQNVVASMGRETDETEQPAKGSIA